MREVEVFGRRLLVEHTASGWLAYFPGEDGKRRSALAGPIPAFVVSDEDLLRFLADMWHESARPDNKEVRWVK